ncbi:MAG: hypothetical protein JWP91_1570, partial [Fibrobacteres bacterium]|nr:hypothetical protein [Fibrobacterota bacterium]
MTKRHGSGSRIHAGWIATMLLALPCMAAGA